MSRYSKQLKEENSKRQRPQGTERWKRNDQTIVQKMDTSEVTGTPEI